MTIAPGDDSTPESPFGWAPTASPVPDAVVTQEPEPAKASGKRGLVIALVIALVAVVGLAGLSVYLWSVHSQYVAQNEQLRDAAESLGGEVGENKAKAEAVQAQLDDTKAQLEEAKDTISGLANSEAQAGDDRQTLIDVADGLQQCADARQNLIDHLNEAYKWTAESLRAYEASTTKYCNRAKDAYDEVVND